MAFVRWHWYLVRYYGSISKIKIQQETKTSYKIEWENWSTERMEKDVADRKYDIIEDLWD